MTSSKLQSKANNECTKFQTNWLENTFVMKRPLLQQLTKKPCIYTVPQLMLKIVVAKEKPKITNLQVYKTSKISLCILQTNYYCLP